MKTIKLMSLFLAAALFTVGCSDDDSPDPVNEEEVITTMRITLSPQGGGTDIVLLTQDLDGDGPNPPVVSTSGDLETATTYTGSIEVLNETENPSEDITAEIQEEDDEHQFFFEASVVTSSVDIAYTDADGDGNPIGLSFTLTTNGATAGTLTVTLRHELDKNAEGVSEGNIENAGGDTDITTTFDINVVQP